MQSDDELKENLVIGYESLECKDEFYNGEKIRVTTYKINPIKSDEMGGFILKTYLSPINDKYHSELKVFADDAWVRVDRFEAGSYDAAIENHEKLLSKMRELNEAGYAG